MTQALLSGAAIGALYVLISIGFALNLEIADIVNAAHGAFVVGAMYVTLRFTEHGVPIYLAVLLASIVIAALSYPIYVLLIRPARAESGHRVQLVFTLLLFSALTVVYQLIFGADLQTLHRRFGSVKIAGGVLTTAQIVAIVLAIVISVMLYLVARFTMLGKLAYVASRYPLGARSVGVPVARIYTLVFVFSGFLAGIGGGVMMTFQPVEPTLGLQYVVVVFLVALVARTHLLGCLLLGLAYGVVQAVLAYELSASTASSLTLVVFLVALVAERLLRLVTRTYRRVATRRPLEVAVQS